MSSLLPQYQPLSVAEMAILWYIVSNGYLNDMELKQVVDFQASVLSFLHDQNQDFLDEINKNPDYSEQVIGRIKTAVKKFKKMQAY